MSIENYPKLTDVFEQAKEKITKLWHFYKENNIELKENLPDSIVMFLDDLEIDIYELNPSQVRGVINITLGTNNSLWELSDKEYLNVYFSQSSSSKWKWKVKNRKRYI